jgi:hypothetical protein
MFEEAKAHYADPHPKRKLRIAAFEKALANGDLAYPFWVSPRKAFVEVKQKPEEYAKRGKKPRSIGDLGVMLSLQGFRLTEYLKQAQSQGDYPIGDGHARFVKDPSPDTLEEVFRKLLDPPGSFYYLYFSDDACYSVRHQGRVVVYNMDISACDSSHTEVVFQALVDLMPEDMRADMQHLVDQCKLPVLLRSVADRKLKVWLQTRMPTLFSGSTITTAINNLANLALAVAMYEYRAYTPVDVALAAETAGYIVTVEECSEPEDIQFLKHSPCYDVDGRLRPLVNLGVFLRASGTVKRDLPGRGPWRPRARAMQAALLACTYAGVSFPMLEHSKTLFPKTTQEALDQVHREQHEKLRASTGVFTDHAILKRYRLDDHGHAQIAQFFGLREGLQLANDALSVVLSRDYGLECLYSQGVLPEIGEEHTVTYLPGQRT